MLVHLTACRAHVAPARRHLKSLAGVAPVTVGTDYLMRHWGQIVDPIEVPVLGYARRTG